jgi:hypothetical protein
MKGAGNEAQGGQVITVGPPQRRVLGSADEAVPRTRRACRPRAMVLTQAADLSPRDRRAIDLRIAHQVRGSRSVRAARGRTTGMMVRSTHRAVFPCTWFHQLPGWAVLRHPSTVPGRRTRRCPPLWGSDTPGQHRYTWGERDRSGNDLARSSLHSASTIWNRASMARSPQPEISRRNSVTV